jgi:hypothetical protein
MDTATFYSEKLTVVLTILIKEPFGKQEKLMFLFFPNDGPPLFKYHFAFKAI